ncbi:hypothetical protein IU11_08570 [Cellulosimicrobium sp. MM]|nr:hypothetical protein IU11_08570 [Cellulosimicrobium sp. MM]
MLALSSVVGCALASTVGWAAVRGRRSPRATIGIWPVSHARRGFWARACCCARRSASSRSRSSRRVSMRTWAVSVGTSPSCVTRVRR